MGLKKIKERVGNFVKKNSFIVLILVIGLAFMLIPGQSISRKSSTNTNVPNTTQESVSLEEQLEKILSNIQGVGNAKVLLTLEAGEETIYQTNRDISTNNDGTKNRIDTVILSTADRAEHGMVCQIIPATYRGAVVICDGASSASIRLAVIEAVSKVTGLGADRISVLKMK